MRLFKGLGLTVLTMLAIVVGPTAAATADTTGVDPAFPGLAAAGSLARETGVAQEVLAPEGIDIYRYLKNDGAGSRCLDLDHGVGPAILAYACNFHSNQYWKLTRTPGTTVYEIKPSAFPNDCVDVRQAVGPDLLKYGCKLSSNQRWAMYTDDGSRIWLKPLSNSNQCLDAELRGTRALAWTCNGGTNQFWHLYV